MTWCHFLLWITQGDLTAKRFAAYLCGMEQHPNDIRPRRMAIRISQKQLAALCSIRPETLSRIEKGKDEVPGYVDMILFLVESDESLLRLAFKKLKETESAESEANVGKAVAS